MRKLGLAILSLALLGCGDAPLTRAECEQLMQKIDDLALVGLNPEEQAEMRALDAEWDDDGEAIEECAAGENWGRSGFHCVMRATSLDGTRKCVLLN